MDVANAAQDGSLCMSSTHKQKKNSFFLKTNAITRTIGSAIRSIRPLPSAGPYPTGDPYLFCVYHKDEYPQGNGKMEAPFPGNGSDFNPDNPYRMYHGRLVPGKSL